MSNTSNMNLVSPTVGVTSGPDWANNLNSDLTIIDAHDHSPGNGVAITPDGMSITGDLPFNSHNITLVRSVRLSAISLGTVTASDVGCLVESGVDLYYIDGNANQIRITQSGSIAGASGTITGLTSPASAAYSAGTFIFQSASNTAASLDVASIIVRKTTASSSGITIAAPSALASNYTMTLLAAAPAATNALFIDSSGNLSAPTSPTFLSNITVNGTVTVGAGGPALSNNTGILTSSAVSFQPGGVLNGTLQGLNALDTLYIAKSDGTVPYPLVVSANPTSHGLKIVRGVLSVTTDNSGNVSGVSITSGEGFSIGATGAAYVNITFSAAFFDVPAMSVTFEGSSITSTSWGVLKGTTTTTTARVGIFQFPSGGGSVVTTLHFMAIGQRV